MDALEELDRRFALARMGRDELERAVRELEETTYRPYWDMSPVDGDLLDLLYAAEARIERMDARDAMAYVPPPSPMAAYLRSLGCREV